MNDSFEQCAQPAQDEHQQRRQSIATENATDRLAQARPSKQTWLALQLSRHLPPVSAARQVDPSEPWVDSLKRTAAQRLQLRSGNEGASLFRGPASASEHRTINLLPLSVDEINLLAEGLAASCKDVTMLRSAAK